MPKIIIALLLLFCLQQNIFAQDKTADERAASIPDASSKSIEALASYIKENFTTDTGRVRAIYIWIAYHISYDVPRLLANDKNPNNPPQPAMDVLSARSAVCQGYTDLFIALCKGVGVDAIRIGGYTKHLGKVSPYSHAWAAVPLNGGWYLFDPTWAAGYVKNDVFVKKYNEDLYKVLPAKFISDHMPFDPMYQFLSYPINNNDFITGTSTANKILFNYNDSLKQHNQLSPVQQTAAELRRLEASGVQNDLIQKRREYLKRSLQSFASKDAFEESRNALNMAVAKFKEYVGHRKTQFTSITDNDLRELVDSIEFYSKQSRSFMQEAAPRTDAQREAKAGNLVNIDRITTQLNKEQQFTTQYFATEKDKRKQLFMRK